MPVEATTGVCLSGAFRSFEEPCAVPHLVKHVFKPLRAHIYAYLNSPADRAEQSMAIAKRVLSSVEVRALHVVPQNDTGRYSGPHHPTCTDGQGANNGYPQSRYFAKCAADMLSASAPAYTWIMRIRPDMHVPYSFMAGLPRHLHFDAPRGAVFAPSAAVCGCGLRESRPSIAWAAMKSMTRSAAQPRPPPSFSVSTCAHGTLCACSGDVFAMIYGAAAQRAYLEGYARDFDTCARRSYTCSACKVNAKPPGSPECKLGATLSHRQVPVYDVRYLVNLSRPEPSAPMLLKCGQFANGRCALAWCANATAADEHAIPILPSMLHAVPPGYWTLEAQALQKRACLAPPERRKGSPWEHLCA